MVNIGMDLLRTLVTVVETGGVGKAGAQLGRTQPAISLQLQRLEEIVGMPLFTRVDRQLRLTEEGEVLLGYARQILQLNDEAVARLNRPKIRGPVRLGTPNDFAVTLLPGLLRDFAQHYPDVELEVACDLSCDLMEGLGRGKFDLVLAMRDHDGGAAADKLWTEPLVWVGSEERPLPSGAVLPLVAYPQGCVYRKRMLAALDGAGVAWRIAFSSPSLSGLRAAVMAGLGLTCWARSTAPDGLRVLDEDGTLPPLGAVTVGLYRGPAPLSKAAQKLEEFLAASLDGVHRRQWSGVAYESISRKNVRLATAVG